MQQRTSGAADSDSIAFEISDIDPKALLKPKARPAPPPEPKRPELRVVLTDRLPKLELPLEPDRDPRTDFRRRAAGGIAADRQQRRRRWPKKKPRKSKPSPIPRAT